VNGVKKNVLILPLLLSLLAISPCLSYAWSGKVIVIADDDTITVLQDGKQQVKIRLYRIDTPERRQAFGTKAKQLTSDMVFGKVVEVEPVESTGTAGRWIW
jgi:micrococcal nuclease